MLSKKVEEALNKQVAYEVYASSSYLSMASWCEKEGLRGTASFLYAQSEEEKTHMLKIFRYINEAGGHALSPALKEPPNKYNSINHVFELALEQEINVTNQINKLVELSLVTQDYASFHFLQWFVEEQLEEEKLFRMILDIIKLAGKEGRSLLLIDNEIGKLREEEEKS